MVFETPLLRVSRPVAACSRCRSAKIKCDGKLPVSLPLTHSLVLHEPNGTRHALLARGPESKQNAQAPMINLPEVKSEATYLPWKRG